MGALKKNCGDILSLLKQQTISAGKYIQYEDLQSFKPGMVKEMIEFHAPSIVQGKFEMDLFLARLMKYGMEKGNDAVRASLKDRILNYMNFSDYKSLVDKLLSSDYNSRV